MIAGENQDNIFPTANLQLAHLKSTFHPNSSFRSSLLAYTIRLTRQYRITGCEGEDILQEASRRAYKKILMGEAVENLGAWLRGIILKVIQEQSKKDKKDIERIKKLSCKTDFLGNWNETLLENAVSINLDFLTTSLSQLSPKEEKTLLLREVNNLSWKEISDILFSSGLEKKRPTEATLRKRHERLLKRLREKYERLKESIEG